MRSHAEFEGYEIKITFYHNKLANLDLLPITLFLVNHMTKLSDICRFLNNFQHGVWIGTYI